MKADEAREILINSFGKIVTQDEEEKTIFLEALWVALKALDVYIESFRCPRCGSDNISKRYLLAPDKSGPIRFVCQSCGKIVWKGWHGINWRTPEKEKEAGCD